MSRYILSICYRRRVDRQCNARHWWAESHKIYRLKSHAVRGWRGGICDPVDPPERSARSTKSLFPFLKMGTICASFQSSGKMPSCKDLLNNMVRDGAIWSAVSFSRRTWIPWDPVALFISSCLIDVKIISTRISRSFSVGCEGVKGWLSADLWGGSEDRHKVRVEQLGDLLRQVI